MGAADHRGGAAPDGRHRLRPPLDSGEETGTGACRRPSPLLETWREREAGRKGPRQLPRRPERDDDLRVRGEVEKPRVARALLAADVDVEPIGAARAVAAEAAAREPNAPDPEDLPEREGPHVGRLHVNDARGVVGMERRDEVRSDADAGGDCDPSAVDEHVEMRMDVERRALPTQSRQTQRAEARAQTVRVRG